MTLSLEHDAISLKRILPWIWRAGRIFGAQPTSAPAEVLDRDKQKGERLPAPPNAARLKRCVEIRT
jgi:hypothetical protein